MFTDILAKRGWLFMVVAAAVTMSCGESRDSATDTQAAPKAANAPTVEFRVGWQKGSNLAILKARGNLDERLMAEGVKISWVEFTAGPQMLEALNTNGIDWGSVGETPPVFAQVANPDLLYVAYNPASPKAEKILLPKGSPIKTVAELKGKTVVLNRGSNVHYLLINALKVAGLKYEDVTVKYLPPPEARVAFESGEVDAWVIWDPFSEAAIVQAGATVLVDGTGGADGKPVAQNYNFYLSTATYAKAHPEVLKAVLEETAKTDKWVLENLDEAARILAPQINLTEAIARESLQHYGYVPIYPLSDDVIANQQAIADTFFGLKLIPNNIDVKLAVWKP